MTDTSGGTGRLAEAAAPEDLLDRLKGMELGDVVALAGGVKVAHEALSDGRAVWRIRGEYSPGESEGMGSMARTAEEAAVAALRRSAQSTDPDSIGGRVRLGMYRPISVSGLPGVWRAIEFDPDGVHVVVTAEDSDADPRRRRVAISSLQADPPRVPWLVEGESGGPRRSVSSEAGISASLWRQTMRLLEADGLLGDEDREMLAESDDEMLAESAKTAGYSVKHTSLERKPGKKDNWVERAGPGGQGGKLPAYITNVAKGIQRGGKTLSQAIGIAIGRIKAWAKGGGDVGPEVRTASIKALAEWEKLKAKNKAGKLKESANDDGLWWL